MLVIYTPIVKGTWISFELEPPTLEEFRERIRATQEQAPWLVCEREGEVQGYAYAKRFWPRAAYQWAVEVTVYVHPDHQRKGVGRALYETLFGLLKLQGYRRALAVIALPNPASIDLHKQLGFSAVGVFHSVGYKLGGWRDVSWWELALHADDAVPTPPKSLAAVVESAESRAILQRGEELMMS